MTGEEFNCDTLTTEIEDIPSRKVRDANIREIVAILIKDLPGEDREATFHKLRCAGRLAIMPWSSENRDAELTREIDANIRANRCSAARSLSDDLWSRSSKSTQKAKVALECLGKKLTKCGDLRALLDREGTPGSASPVGHSRPGARPAT